MPIRREIVVMGIAGGSEKISFWRYCDCADQLSLHGQLDAHRRRNLVERFFSKLNYFRRVATRYDKLAETYSPS